MIAVELEKGSSQMKAHFLAVSAAVALLGGGAALGWLAASSQAVPEAYKSPASDDSGTDDHAAEFLQRLLDSPADLGSRNPVIREAVVKVVCQRIRSEPTIVKSVWAVLRPHITTTMDRGQQLDGLLGPLTELLAFSDAVRDGEANCRSISDFDDVIQIEIEIDQTFALLRKAIAEEIRKGGEVTLSGTPPQSIDDAKKALKHFVVFARENENAFGVLLATAPTDSDDGATQTLLPIRRQLLTLLAIPLEHVQRHIDTRRRSLTEDSFDLVDPSGQSLGQCENLIAEIHFIDDLRHNNAVAVWLQPLQSADSGSTAGAGATQDAKAASLSGDASQPAKPELTAGELLAQLQLLQVLFYNFWALREIQSAETSDSWDGRLAPIDTGLLESTVSSLYSSVYARRIEEIQDPEQRSHIVQTLLNTKKIGSSAF